MADETYKPISCDNHDELEAAAVRKKEVELEFEKQGVLQRERGRIADVYTNDGAEWVRLQGTGGTIEVRLDEIVRMREFS
ncbi:MAG: Rho-binding antiterminator [Thermoanaerobaculia bacterium]